MERDKKIAFLTIHDIWFDTQCFQKNRKSIVTLHTNEVLDEDEYDFKQITKTFLLDIQKDKDAIFAGFDYKSARYAINKAIRDGVIVHSIQTREEREQYLSFQKAFCEKKGIPCLDDSELEYLKGYYACSKDGEYLGACMFLESANRDTVRYKYGATQHKLNANEIILWRAICDYHDLGFRYFDFGGCTPTDDKNSYYYRHYHFKKKFGGELIDSYTYYKIRGGYRAFFYIFQGFVNLFFHGDVNAFTNWLSEKKILK